MSEKRLDIHFEQGQPLKAQDMNEIVQAINDGPSVYVKLVRLLQSEYDALVNEGTVDEMTLYIVSPDPVTEVTATFIDENGTTLYTETIDSGETPVYGGATPSKEDDYDPTENLGTEYDWDSSDGWTPAIGPITQNTTYTVKYTERQFRYVDGNEKWIREDGTTIDNTKNYILVGDFVSLDPSDIDLGINGDFNTSNNVYGVSELYFTDIEKSFSDLYEFAIDDADAPTAPTTLLQVQSIDGNIYIKDTSTNKYLGTISSANRFSVTEADDPTTLGDTYKWIIDANNEIYNSVNTRYIRLNPSSGSIRFAPYKSGQSTTHLYYQHKERVKEYIVQSGNRMLLNASPQTKSAFIEDVPKGKIINIYTPEGDDTSE